MALYLGVFVLMWKLILDNFKKNEKLPQRRGDAEKNILKLKSFSLRLCVSAVKYKVFATSLILCLILVILPVVGASADVIDRILVVVNGEIITLGDLDDAVEVSLLRTPGERHNRVAVEKDVLEELIDRRLLIQEARRLMISEISAEEIDEAVRQVKTGYTDAEVFKNALADADMGEADLREQLKDQLLIQRFIERRVRLLVRVDMDEVKRFFEANKEGMGDRSFREFRDELRELLIEKKTNERLEEYRKELRERADIRYN